MRATQLLSAQVLASESQWRKAAPIKERMKACATLTEYLRHNHAASTLRTDMPTDSFSGSKVASTRTHRVG